MVHQVKALTAKPTNLSLILRTHRVEEKDRLSQVVLRPLNICYGVLTHYIHIQNKQINMSPPPKKKSLREEVQQGKV